MRLSVVFLVLMIVVCAMFQGSESIPHHGHHGHRPNRCRSTTESVTTTLIDSTT
ncbi:hypothetical protein ALC56_04286 [Trachymyrmex septentrionalis]|uniref:Uncharacterized protein n=1 Tax=Trachymyrmex septentrionalis TaxID=34720 RepID=A0A195FKE2_9HYME|nr:hypothetical protein ALC56_04286 [Trachymyrmex septentrionalis]